MITYFWELHPIATESMLSGVAEFITFIDTVKILFYSHFLIASPDL